MKRWILLGGVSISVFIGTACGQEQSVQGYPRPVRPDLVLQEDDVVWDFQDVIEGEVVTHEFLFKNESQDTLTVQDVVTSCGCTASEVKVRTLLPGEETPIEVKFDSKDYKGKVQQFIFVQTDSRDKPVVRYIIKANVVANQNKKSSLRRN